MVLPMDWRRPLTLLLASACLTLAMLWPMWRNALGAGYSGYGYYSYGYSYSVYKYSYHRFGYGYRPFPRGQE